VRNMLGPNARAAGCARFPSYRSCL
jgi:hypothetical protein